MDRLKIIIYLCRSLVTWALPIVINSTVYLSKKLFIYADTTEYNLPLRKKIEAKKEHEFPASKLIYHLA